MNAVTMYLALFIV